MKDSFGRKPRDLKKSGDDASLKILSSYTIGDLMKEEENAVMVWPNSFYEGNEELKEQFIFRITEKDDNKIDSVTTNNVVGFIGKKRTNIRIHSRFSSIDKDGKGDDFFLYYMLEKVLAINTFSFTSSAGSNAPQVFDFLLFFFPKLLKEAMSQGMYKKYVYHEYNDANVRGVIDINRHIRRNIPANGKIAYRTREFSYDNPVTQLIRHTIEFIRRKTFGKAVLHNDPDTEGYVQQIIQATPSFQPRQMQSVINDNLRPVSHPYYTKYAALQKLCLRILRHEKLSYGENGDKIHGILIDAAWLWEEYIAQVLAEGTGMKHYTRKSSPYHLFEKDTSKYQKIIPDYLDVDNKIVADAKYIPLIKDELSAEKAAPVYYKTIMYMYRFEAKKGFLFHPVAKKKDEETGEIVAVGDEPFVVKDYTIEGRPDCHLYKVGLVVADNVTPKKEGDNVKKKRNEKVDDDWRQFRKTMNDREGAFVKRVEELKK
jgi:5-methylcytosine-specific restriction endonuclease McrBC regulatory subunit McrC